MKRPNNSNSSHHSSSNRWNKVLLYSFLIFTSILLILLVTRHYDYDQRFHAKQDVDHVTTFGNIFKPLEKNGENQQQAISWEAKPLAVSVPKKKIAYVFAGSARSFICPQVHWSLRFNAIDAFGGDPYVFVRISAEDNLNDRTGKGRIWTPKYEDNDIEEALKILNPRKVQYFSLKNQLEEMAREYPGEAHEVFRNNDLRRYSMFFQRCMGYKLVLQYEKENNMKFDWVALIRLDAGWSMPVMPIESFSDDRVWLTETGYVAYNDQFMLIPRKFSDYLFDLNTKVDRRVYCLGGPDVERWKCNATHLTNQGISKDKIDTTLKYCCSDMFGINIIGYSETIHYRHFEYGNISVGFAKLPVYLTRYHNNQCRPDCDRLMYNFKAFEFNVLQKKYPYTAPMNGADTRASTLSLVDTAQCYAMIHESSLWQPFTAAKLHKFQRRKKYSIIDYSKSLYEQGDVIPKELLFHIHDFDAWRIHPTMNVEGCLGYDGVSNSLVWDNCIFHLKRKGGFRHYPPQTFFVSLIPHKPVRMNTVFASHQDPFLQAPYDRTYNVTRILHVVRELEGFLWKDRLTVCFSVDPALRKVEMKKCVRTVEEDRSQWFEVIGEGPGSHPLTTVAKMRSLADPKLCVSRGNEVERDQKVYVESSGLALRECDANNPQTMYFEFELLQ